MDGGVPAFGHVLHLLYLIGLGDRAGADASRSGNCLQRIADRFRAEGCPLRNAGALCAAICADAPRAADAPELADDPRDPDRRKLGAVDRAFADACRWR